MQDRKPLTRLVRSATQAGRAARRGCSGLLLAAVLGGPWAGAHAQSNPQNITVGEMALVPEYCADSQTFETRGFPENPTPGQRRWLPQMGPAFWAIHHYCWALINANRSRMAGVPPQQRQHLLRAAISDCFYVLQNSQRDFVLRPEIHLRMGQYHNELGEPIRALDAFRASMEAKPDYWPAYLAMSELQQRLGQRQRAQETLQAGLQQIPDDPRLTEALRALSAPQNPTRQPARPSATASR